MARRQVVREKETVFDDNEFYEAIPTAQPTRVVGVVPERYSAARVVAWLTSAVVLLLALRILLRLVGANDGNLVVYAIYGLTQPLVAPFAGAITLPLDLAVGAFEWASVIALVVYAVLGSIIVGFIRAARPTDINDDYEEY